MQASAIINSSGLIFETAEHQAAQIAHLPNLLPMGLWLGIRLGIFAQDPGIDMKFAAFERQPKWHNAIVVGKLDEDSGEICGTVLGALPNESAHLAFDDYVTRACFPALWDIGLTVISIERALPLLLRGPFEPTYYRATQQQVELLRSSGN